MAEACPDHAFREPLSPRTAVKQSKAECHRFTQRAPLASGAGLLLTEIMSTILVTGGCGFIGSNFVRLLCAGRDWRIVNLDKLTYAGNIQNLDGIDEKRCRLVNVDIADRGLMDRLLEEERPWAIVNFAAESHVDRSIQDACPFLETNITGTQNLSRTGPDMIAVMPAPQRRFGRNWDGSLRRLLGLASRPPRVGIFRIGIGSPTSRRGTIASTMTRCTRRHGARSPDLVPLRKIGVG